MRAPGALTEASRMRAADPSATDARKPASPSGSRTGHPHPSADDVGVNTALTAIQKRNSFQEPTVIDGAKCLARPRPARGYSRSENRRTGSYENVSQDANGRLPALRSSDLAAPRCGGLSLRSGEAS
jgi:hypothetical protein